MLIQEELQLVRVEVRALRQELARYKHAWELQKARADRFEQENHELRVRIKLLEKHNDELKEKLVSTMSYKDKLAGMIFKTNVKKEENDKGRKRGGQAGHTGHGRSVPEQIDEEKNVYLSQCPDCGNGLEQSEATYERIVEDIPPPQKIVTRYHIQRQWCRFCNKEVRGTPSGTLEGFRIGINAISWILFHKYRLRTPLAKIEEGLLEQYRLALSQGGIQDILHGLKERLGRKYEAIIKEIRTSAVKHADETGWRIDGENSWCWLFATNKAAYYTIEETRGKGVPIAVLGQNPQGVLVRDDYASYDKLPMEQQSCWVHLLRASKEAVRREGSSEEAVHLHRELKQLFHELQTIVEQPFQTSERAMVYGKYLKRIEAIQRRGYRNHDSQQVQTRIKNQGEHLLTALKYNGVPLTNNHAERQIRPMVVTRKISGGSRSPKGAATHAVNMSVAQTILLEGKSFFAGIKELLRPQSYQYVLEKTE